MRKGFQGPLGVSFVGGKPVDLVSPQYPMEKSQISNGNWSIIRKREGFLSGLKTAKTYVKGRNIEAFNRKKMASGKWLVERSGVEWFLFMKDHITQEPYKRNLDFHLLLSRPSQSQYIQISIEWDITLCVQSSCIYEELMYIWRVRLKRIFKIREALNNWSSEEMH